MNAARRAGGRERKGSTGSHRAATCSSDLAIYDAHNASYTAFFFPRVVHPLVSCRDHSI
jgi:hypothetical protein